MFLENRIYQGSSGKVYPLPFTDRIAETKVERRWTGMWIENEFLRVLVLPELGGRIHRAIDNTNGYDLIYHQAVIKPALVGLAGPWISGGIEFNWPQHHRPATFLPARWEIEQHADGSKTIWCSDHDPMCRMKGMHGVCLYPDRAVLELKVRVHNRTSLPQTFLWWANVGTRVHEGYQSFFPPDVHYVADHARRSMCEYPLARGHYYGVNYGERGRRGVPQDEVPPKYVPPHCLSPAALAPPLSDSPSPLATLCYAANDISWYANIPTPCSYMCLGSQEDFCGGYDHRAEAGLVHVANHHLSPGKKQWTWGNHPFGYAWDRNLTDADANGEYAPYIEIMAGVFTDNQPDFSFLGPSETRSWSQFWYPIQKIGPAHHANVDAAVNLAIERQHIRLGVCVTKAFPGAVIHLETAGATLEWKADLMPGNPLVVESKPVRQDWTKAASTLRVLDSTGSEIISYSPKAHEKATVPTPASEPPSPAEIASADELYVTGLHLEQYRHATRCPTLYWHEALRRDPLDARCNNALGMWHLRRGEFTLAEAHFCRAVERLTCRNANPYDGEPFYNLGLCRRFLGREAEAYAALYKATWNQAWAGAASHVLAEIDCTRCDWRAALDHLDRALRLNADNLRARNLRVLVLRRLNRQVEATALLQETLAVDPLDWWARHLAGEAVTCDLQTCLDLAHDFAHAGLFMEAIELLAAQASACSQTIVERSNDGANHRLPDQSWGALPIVHYTLGWLWEKCGDPGAALATFQRAAAASPDYCFPARLEEIAVLEAAMRANPRDARAPYYLGNLLYDRRRHEEAIRLWERSAKLDPKFSVVWRNLGIGRFNVQHNAAKARAAYNRACQADPADARLFHERDQLWKRTGEAPARRLRQLQRHLDLVRQRDDLSIELCALYNQTGQPEKALQWLSGRRFQPWEGGEGQALGQHVRTQLALGRQAMAQSDFSAARTHFERALESPENLGEARHLLANQSDVHYWLGCACDALGDRPVARKHWRIAATFRGDFQEMSIRAFSEMTFYSARAWEKLGQGERAGKLFRELLAHSRQLAKSPATIDFFATSLPTMLLFNDDLQARQEITALFLEAQARLGLGQRARARVLLNRVLRRDPNHSLAGDLLKEL
jgi:tetratricopeptide (TPR) repeat protein